MSALDIIRIARAAGAKLIVDGASLVLEAESPPPPQVFDMLRAHKPEILELLQAERRAVLRHIADHFQSSPLGQCAHCGGERRADDPFVTIFVGEDRADGVLDEWELPEEFHCVGREYWARTPGSEVWVQFSDLPEAVREQLWAKHRQPIAFPAGLEGMSGL